MNLITHFRTLQLLIFLGLVVGCGAPKKIYMNQLTSEVVKAQYSKWNAEDAIIIYQGVIDGNDDGIFDGIRKLQDGLDNIYPVDPDYSGPLVLDWEGVGGGRLYAAPIDSELFKASALEFQKALAAAKELRPKAKVSFYGFPMGSYWTPGKHWYDRNIATGLMEKMDQMTPSLYDVYPSTIPYHTPQMDIDYVHANTQMSLELASGKPVYPYIAHRWYNSDGDYIYKLIPEAEFKEHMKAIWDAKDANGKTADGVIFWGVDQYWWSLAKRDIQPGELEYPYHLQTKNAFKEELDLKSSDAEVQSHWDKIHTNYLTWLHDVILEVETRTK